MIIRTIMSGLVDYLLSGGGITLSTAPLQAIEQLGSRAEREDGYAFTEGDTRYARSVLPLSPRLCVAHHPKTSSVLFGQFRSFGIRV